MCCSYTNRYGNLDDDEYSSVSIADEDEAYKAVNELYRKGHRRIAALISTPDDWSISQLRYRGYRRALEEHGLPFDESLVVSAGSFSIKDAYAAMKEQLNRNPDFTAVFAIADDMAIGAMKALREGGKRVPEDCSVIAIDGLTVSDYIQPTLTTLCQPMREMGQKSVEILLDMIEGRGENRHLTLETKLRRGASVKDMN